MDVEIAEIAEELALVEIGNGVPAVTVINCGFRVPLGYLVCGGGGGAGGAG